MHFPAIYSMQVFDIFWPSCPTMVGIRAKLKLAKFDWHFSQYHLEKLIRTLYDGSNQNAFHDQDKSYKFDIIWDDLIN